MCEPALCEKGKGKREMVGVVVGRQAGGLSQRHRLWQCVPPPPSLPCLSHYHHSKVVAEKACPGIQQESRQEVRKQVCFVCPP